MNERQRVQSEPQVDADWMLPAELLVALMSITQQVPEQRFVTFLALSQVTGELFLARCFWAIGFIA